MDAAAQEFLDKLRESVTRDDVELTGHFEQRLGERGLLWVDFLTILDQPTAMEDQGLDAHGWPKWRITGRTADDVSAAVVVALRLEGRARFITIFWED